MSRYRFEISANGFFLKSHFTDTEEGGLNHCKAYISQFQRQVANVPMKVIIAAREKKNNPWEYRKAPYIPLKTLHKKPYTEKPKD